MQRKKYNDFNVVIVAAGASKRFKGRINKVFSLIYKTPAIVHTVMNFNLLFDEESIIVVTSRKDMNRMKRVLKRAGLSKVKITEGGPERCFSVLNGLKEANKKKVLIHDGARIFVPKKNIAAVCDSLKDKVSCSALAVKPAETVRRAKKTGYELIDRNSLYLMQTPQACYREEYIKILSKCVSKNQVYTDDMEYFSKSGKKVALVDGDRRNIKLTTREDLSLAEKTIKKGERCS